MLLGVVVGVVVAANPVPGKSYLSSSYPKEEDHVRSRQAKKEEGPFERKPETDIMPNYYSEEGERENSFEEEGNAFSPDQPTIESESEFIAHCQDWFSSFEDDMISQNDFSSFLADVCDILDEDDDLPALDCPEPTFDSLGLNVQVLFAKHLCGSSQQPLECLASLVASSDEFGYEVAKKKQSWIMSTLVEELCCGLLPFLELARLDEDAGTYN
jgi:hypothetical protein